MSPSRPFILRPVATSLLMVEGDRVRRDSDAVLAIYQGLGLPWALVGIARLQPCETKEIARRRMVGRKPAGAIEGQPGGRHHFTIGMRHQRDPHLHPQVGIAGNCVQPRL